MGVGMRIVRPLAAMSAEDKQRVWEADVEASARTSQTGCKKAAARWAWPTRRCRPPSKRGEAEAIDSRQLQ